MSQLFSSDNQRKLIKTRHSFYETRSPNVSIPSKSETFSRSEVNIIRTNDFPSIIDSGCVNRYGFPAKVSNSEEYYKNYEHDDIPVKDDSYCSGDLSDNAATGDRKELTNSDLEKMEVRIYRNISKELQTDDSSTQNSLDSNVKLFKTAVQEIFDNFNNNMRDFDLYKKKFQDIISRNQDNSVDEMEDFFKEIIKNIISSESCETAVSNENDLLTCSMINSEATNEVESSTFSHDTENDKLKIQKTIEAYKNENYYTDSAVDKESSNTNRKESREKTFNMYLLSVDSCLEIKTDGRNLLSEINIRHPHVEDANQIASAENIKSAAAKKLQLQHYMSHTVECQSNDTIIPVKISYAKKNIHSEDSPDDFAENNKSFIFKICNFLCKKLRRNSFG